MKGARELATRAAREAARVRTRLGIGPTSSLCPLDIAEALGIVVRLDALPSLEGMYAPGDRDTVLLGAERPWGRVRHTCGHELGHHVFQHGTCEDELCVGRQPTWEPEEYLADRFSTALTMPKLAVGDALRRRGWNPATLTAEQAFLLAQDFGVGYRNFVSHAERSLRMLSPSAADSLRRQGRQLGRLRTAVAGFEVEHDVFVGDEHWGARPMDIETGDIVVVPNNALFAGRCARFSCEPKAHLVAVASGVGQLKLRTRHEPIRVRVGRRGAGTLRDSSACRQSMGDYRSKARYAAW